MSIEGEIWEERLWNFKAALKTGALAASAEINRRINDRLKRLNLHTPIPNEEITKVIVDFIESSYEGLG